MLEAAIITPLLLLLTFSIVDFGALFYVYLALENGVSQATRYGVTGNVMDDPPTRQRRCRASDSIKLAMRQATPTLTINDGAFTFAHRSIGGGAWLGGVGGPNEIEKVTVNYTWNAVLPDAVAVLPERRDQSHGRFGDEERRSMAMTLNPCAGRSDARAASRCSSSRSWCRLVLAARARRRSNSATRCSIST